MKLLVATSNPGKLAEIREIAGAPGLELRSLAEVALPPPDETGVTFHENAAAKATECAAQSGLWTLAELPPGEKNKLSHRGRALERLRPLLQRLAAEGAL